jgi:hypothetical protein
MSVASIDPTPEHRLHYDEAVRAIDHQLDSVDAAQTRAGLLLAALAISAAEVGGRAVDRAGNPFPVSQAVAWASLIACAGALLFAMWPRSLKSSFKVERFRRKPADHLMQDITLDLTFRRAENGRKIEQVWLALRVAMVALSVNVAAWGTIVLWR